MDVREIDLAAWGDALPSSGFEPFHLPDALQVIEQHAGGDLVLYGGFNGDRPVGLFPAFVADRYLTRTVTSPPPSLGIPRLGPVLNPNSPKQRKQEQINRRFTEGVLDALAVDSRRTLFRVIGSTAFMDPRPFRWSGLDIDPAFTYRLDVESMSREDLLMSFSKSRRKEIRAGDELEVTVGVEGLDAARAIHEALVRVYDQQGKTFHLSWPYVRDMVKSLADRVRVYVAREPSGAFLNGMITLYTDDTAYSWLGGMGGEYEDVSTNSLVKWGMLTDLVEDPPFETVRYWDMVGANTAHLCRYKSAFGGEVLPYYRIESSGKPMELAKTAYRLVRS